MSEEQTIVFFITYGILLVGIIMYYWRWSIKKGREEFQKEWPELHRLKTDDSLTDEQITILTMQMLKRDNNRMAIRITYDYSLNYQQIKNLHKYIKENEEYIMMKREELIENQKQR